MLQIFLIIETLLIILCIGFVIFFSNKRAKEMLEWRARKAEIADLLQKRTEEEEKIKTLKIQESSYSNQITDFSNQLTSIKKEISIRKEQIDDLSVTEEAIRAKMQQERDIWFEQYKQEQQKELLIAASDFTEQFREKTQEQLNAGLKLADQIAQMRNTISSAIDAEKRKQDSIDKYRIQLDDKSIEDINKIKNIMDDLNFPEILGKLMWKVYYEKPYTDLCGRLFNKSNICGIYKITNINNKMCYVGQAVNVQERWRQHIKRAIGAETPTNNKLYPAMLKYGVENFTFELIEETTRDKLNEREDYWQDFYKAKEYGYSIK